MPWIKLDDGFWDHPKIIAVGERLAVLHQRAMMWSARHATGGHIPDGALRAIGMTRAQARKLTENRLWDEAKDGWKIHDWEVYNPSHEGQKERRDAWEKQRLKWREEKAAYRARRKNSASGTPDSPSDTPDNVQPDTPDNVQPDSPPDSPGDCVRDVDEESHVPSRHVTSYERDSDSDEGPAAPPPTPSPLATATAPPKTGNPPAGLVPIRDAITQAAANGSPVMAAVLRLATPSQDDQHG